MKLTVVKEFTFDSAHKLPWHKGKCFSLHGHQWKLSIGISGEINTNGIILDFNDLKEIVNKEIIDKCDHNYLNDIFPNPTAEIMAQSFFVDLEKVFLEKFNLKLEFVKLWETPTSFVEVRQ